MNLKIILVFISCLTLLNCADVKKEKDTKVKSYKTSLYSDLEGNAVAIEDFKGKRILLNFWATWCTPCLQEMPSMVKAQEILKNEDYVFLFATTDSNSKIRDFKKNSKYPFQFLQFNSTLDKLNIYALPATFVYDTQGNKVKRFDGATEWDSEEMLHQLRAIK